MLHALQQEEIFNVFIDDWKSLGAGLEALDQTGYESVGLLLLKTYADHKYTKNKVISSVNWHPTFYGMIAVALTERTEEQSDNCTDFTPKRSFIVFYNLAYSSKAQV
ncbi:WD repeat-containing protein 63, partial [Austrofundulus limnaeus]|uniref:WD repeat-containing protein 63 n=1 Tax=Austrofundulus limnaeus TaxID=52670 RepID=A0A2I4AM07_AUSLI